MNKHVKRLEAAGVKSPALVKMEWGTYWHDSEKDIPPSDMREGHICKDGKIFEWPFDVEARTSGTPILLQAA